jgi:hypothetical protein
MELVNDFVVNSPIDQAWATLTDVEKIAPCLPGAHLEAVEGDTYKGVVKIKVGPIHANFKGEAQFAEKDDANHRAVLNAAGKDTGNKGNASAVITAQLEALGATSTRCTVSTDLKITGKFAQFGRGAMQDISAKLLEEFVHNLESLTAAAPAPASGNGALSAADQPAQTPPEREDVLDLGQVAGPAILKRLVPVLGVLLVAVLVLRWLRKRG